MNIPAGYLTSSQTTLELHPSLAEVSPHSICSGPLKKLLICCGNDNPFVEAFVVHESTAAVHASLVSTASQRTFGAIDASAIAVLVHCAFMKEALGPASPGGTATEDPLGTVDACGAGAAWVMERIMRHSSKWVRGDIMLRIALARRFIGRIE